ncbi:manganese catalase family protein [Thermoleophilum album]|jgi:Mn-containing catalase|uniref:manganese catalase family protein n=1 Tax=Thermoleophilum album TaxID=29539 RepID=UPI00237CFCE0|nr:manganese catalase family protein [Thermoleophilum album]WDT93174.1 manganese catalase family protein [Thermoleophilum album]
MYLRIDKLQVELPMPSDPDPQAAAAVQELLGGRFGEMSTLMNYTYQSFNLRGRSKVKPFYDLIANIATEELGHIELVAATINGLLTGATDGDDPRETPLRSALHNAGIKHHFINTGAGALVTNSLGQGWNGEYVFNSGDLVLDLLHNFFLECGARMAKIRVYEMTDHPIARQMLGYLFVRGGVHALAYAKALEELTGVDVKKMLPIPKIPDADFKEARKFIDQGIHTKLYRFSPDDFRDIASIWKGEHPHDGAKLEVQDGPPQGGGPADPPEEPAVFSPGLHPEELRQIAERLVKNA